MKLSKWHVKALSVILGLILWEVIALATKPIFLATPLQTFGAFLDLAWSGTVLKDLAMTLRTFLIGLSISVIMGTAIGIVVGYSRPIRIAVDHYISAFYSTPYVAWMPLIILWLGIGDLARVAVVVFAAIWPMIINIMYGIAYIDEGLLEVGKVFGCTSRQILAKIILPGSVPFIASGFRLAVGRAIVGTLFAEMFLQLVGLGGSILRYGALLQTDRVLALIIVTMLLGLGFTALGKWAELKSAAWRVSR